MRDFFVSYNGKDRPWAEWIAWTLEENAYTVLIQAWDFRPGENFVLEMQRATTESKRTIAVLSDNYLKAEFTQPEWTAAFAQDPQGESRKLIPIRVAPCELTGLHQPLIYADLVGLDEVGAKETLLAALRDRDKPELPPRFPGSRAFGSSRSAQTRSMPYKQPFPGRPSTAVHVWREKVEFLQGQEAIVSDPNQRFALKKQIEEAQQKIRELEG